MPNENDKTQSGAEPVRSHDWLGRIGERKPPELKIAQNKEGTHYALGGFEELDVWALRNVPTWKAISERCKYGGISETDRLKMLCAALLAEGEEAKNLALRYAERFGIIAP